MNFKNFQHFVLISGLAAIASILSFGCGGSSVELQPDYNNPIFAKRDLRRDSVQFVKVIDKRAVTTNRIGTAQVGIINTKVPYNLTVPLTELVKTALDSLIAGPVVPERFAPITVFVDSFRVGEHTSVFSEEGHFDCKMRFAYRIAGDSIRQTGVISSQQSSGMDVTNSLEGLIYQGLVECAKKFVEETLDKRKDLVMFSRDSAAILAGGHPFDSTRYVVSLDTAKMESGYYPTPSVPPVTMGKITLHYLRGGKITTGIRGGYDFLIQGGDPKIYYGAGSSITFFDITNNDAQLAGTFFNFGGRMLAQYHLTQAKTSPYIAVGLTLAFGNEKISYGTRDETSFFFGPVADEMFGISIENRFNIEGGAFQLRYFGSKLLPSDIGFLVGCTIGI